MNKRKTAMTPRDRYLDLIRRHLGREPKSSDGLKSSAIASAERRLKIVLPAAMSEYYLIAGRLDQINKSHNILFTPAGLYIKDGHLWFMEENQAVVHWGIPVNRLAEEDPMVYQRVNEEGMKWYSQRLRFSKFLTRVFDWQAGFASAPK